MDTSSSTHPKRPRWLDEEPVLLDLLNHFLDKVEGGGRLSIKISEKSTPHLYDSEVAEDLWALYKALDKDFHILSIKLVKVKSYQQPYEGARVTFMEDKEAMVRQWLNRPRLDPFIHIWEAQVKKLATHFEDYGQALLESPIKIPHKSPEQILAGFVAIGRELNAPCALRTLSARCFWGDSKFLDKRQEQIEALYPSLTHQILPRPILLNVYVPTHWQQVIFVENQDTFLTLTSLNLTKVALVYSAGFRGASSRIRLSGVAQFAMMNTNIDVQTINGWTGWWHDSTLDKDKALLFWGDCDYAGAAILKSLRENFPTLSAWQGAYQCLIARMEQGLGHGHAQCGKELQRDPLKTGCTVMDEQVLPAMRELGQFMDQEAVGVDTYKSLLEC